MLMYLLAVDVDAGAADDAVALSSVLSGVALGVLATTGVAGAVAVVAATACGALESSVAATMAAVEAATVALGAISVLTARGDAGVDVAGGAGVVTPSGTVNCSGIGAFGLGVFDIRRITVSM